MKVETMLVAGIIPAIRAMRLPMKSGSKSDSGFCDFEMSPKCNCCPYASWREDSSDMKCECPEESFHGAWAIGEKDHELSMKLIKSGSDHRKHIRLIDVWMEIEAPLFWWKEFDTYRMGVDKVSESTMHTITKEPFDHMQFETEGMQDPVILESAIDNLNYLRDKWLNEANEEEKHSLWKSIICLLPESYLQTRIVKCSYEALNAIYHARKNHRLKEWRQFCKTLETLPYSEFITGEDV